MGTQRRSSPLWIAILGLAMGCGRVLMVGEEGKPDAGGGARDSGHALDAGLPDAGLPDAGAPDAGPPDAGVPDAGQPDAGRDAGPDLDGGTDGGACGSPATVISQGMQSDEGWPLTWPTCSTASANCTNLYTRRFTNQAALDVFFADELQATAAAVNFFNAEALVVYNCGCSTRGYTLAVDNLSSDGCTLTVSAKVTAPGPACIVNQTFSRLFLLIKVAAGSGPNTVINQQVKVVGCD